VSREPPEIDSAAVLGPAAGVAWVAVGDEIVVHRVDPPDSFVLNATAGLLWQCLDGTSRVGDILDDLADAFRTDRAEVEKDCVPVVNTWLAHHLAEEVDRA
jgi:coenzyme PQQ synthesis protein D (PqqD)